MMNPYYSDESVTLHQGDCLDVLRELADGSADAVVTDPPYALSFMGREWDGWDTPKAFQSWCETWAAECLRVLKPGGHLLAFGGSRTGHRLAAGIEDAGLEIRDSIAWLYGSGFPKSRNLDGEWSGWGTALKPAFEPIVVGRKPLVGTVAHNVAQHGTGALHIDACRTAVSDSDRDEVAGRGYVSERSIRTVYGGFGSDGGRSAIEYAPGGRWPTNVALDKTVVTALDEQTGILTSGKMRAGIERANRDGWAGAMPTATGAETYGDRGGASRFFPAFRYEAKASSAERPEVNGVRHPTVKPLEFMRWLVRLVTPPGGLVLDPFAGSGTTAEACVLERFRCVAIEREAEYLPLIVARLSKPVALGFDFGEVSN